MLCNYGCGKEAKYQFNNGKWCCSLFVCQCMEIRKINKNKNIGKKIEKSVKVKTEEKCFYCGNKAYYYFKKRDKYCCSEFYSQCLEVRKKNTSIKGRKISRSEETCKKLSISNKGVKRNDAFKEKRRIYMINGGAAHCNSFPRDQNKIEKLKQLNREKLLNGKAAYMNKFIKNPSKPEVKLREMVKELYPTCEFQYQVLNYVLDVAIPEYNLAIEFDGWYHFDTEDHKKYHSKRQKEIEDCGWKFIRYNIFELFPSIEKLKEDIYLYLESEVYK